VQFPIVKDRALEYGFVFEELNLKNKGRILDVGICESTLPFILGGLKYDVYGIDIRPFPIKPPTFKFKLEDIRKTSFPIIFLIGLSLSPQ